MILATRFTFFFKEVEKTFFSPKIGLTTYYLWRHIPYTKQLTINKLVSKSVRAINEQLLKISGADVLSSGKKLRKTLWGRASTLIPPSPSPLVRPRSNLFENKVLLFRPLLNCSLSDQLILSSLHSVLFPLTFIITLIINI